MIDCIKEKLKGKEAGNNKESSFQANQSSHWYVHVWIWGKKTWQSIFVNWYPSSNIIEYFDLIHLDVSKTFSDEFLKFSDLFRVSFRE